MCDSCEEDKGIYQQRLVRYKLICTDSRAVETGGGLRMQFGRRLSDAGYDETTLFS